MPTVLRRGPYRLYFTSHDLGEPPHIHIDRDQSSAKFWLNPVTLVTNIGFSAKELRVIAALVKEVQGELQEAWDEFFGT